MVNHGSVGKKLPLNGRKRICWRHPIFTEPWLWGGRIYAGWWLDMTRPRFREDYMTFDCEGCLWWDICWWKVSWTDMNLRGRRSLPTLFQEKHIPPKRLELLWQLDKLHQTSNEKNGGASKNWGGVFLSFRGGHFTTPFQRIVSTARGVYLSCEDGYINVTESTCERSSHCAGGAVEVQKPENSVNHGIFDNR